MSHLNIKKILKLLGKNKEYLTYGVLSNGSFIDADIMNLLKKTEVKFVQLSIDIQKLFLCNGNSSHANH